MFVSAEISYYPLSEDFTAPIDRFIKLVNDSGLQVEPGPMSTVLTGEFETLMALLTSTMAKLMNDYPSVFTIKLSNACIPK